jgi:very-short-patch-repair endonuclease
MSDERALDTIIADVSNSIRYQSAMRLERLPRKTESPIERMLFIGIVGFSFAIPRYNFAGSVSLVEESEKWPTLHVDTQVQVDRYRVDILVRVTLGGKEIGAVVAECDGHDFHERTKEQASRDKGRDRFLTMNGFTVLRFTGSEIYNGVHNCAGDIHDTCWKIFEAAKATGARGA